MTAPTACWGLGRGCRPEDGNSISVTWKGPAECILHSAGPFPSTVGVGAICRTVMTMAARWPRFKFLAESRARAEQTSDIHRELPNIRVSDAWTGKSAGAAGELRAWQVIDCRLGFRVPGQLKSRSSTADSSLDSESVGPGPGRWRTPRLGPPLRLGSGRLEPRRLLKRRPASPAAVESPATAPRQA